MLVFARRPTPPARCSSPEEVRAIGLWAAEHDIWVSGDEIYEHLVYGDARWVSLPAVTPELGDRWIVVNGVAKSYAMTGWRIGWMISAPDVMDAAFNYQSQTTSNISNISQRAAIAALTGDLMAVAEMREVFDRRRRTMVDMLNDVDGMTCARTRRGLLLLSQRVGTARPFARRERREHLRGTRRAAARRRSRSRSCPAKPLARPASSG